MSEWSSGMTQHYAHAETDVQLISHSLLHLRERNKFLGCICSVSSNTLSLGSVYCVFCHSTITTTLPLKTCWPTSTPVTSREAHNGSRELATKNWMRTKSSWLYGCAGIRCYSLPITESLSLCTNIPDKALGIIPKAGEALQNISCVRAHG